MTGALLQREALAPKAREIAWLGAPAAATSHANGASGLDARETRNPNYVWVPPRRCSPMASSVVATAPKTVRTWFHFIQRAA